MTRSSGILVGSISSLSIPTPDNIDWFDYFITIPVQLLILEYVLTSLSLTSTRITFDDTKPSPRRAFVYQRSEEDGIPLGERVPSAGPPVFHLVDDTDF